jgi:hypothetical protein
MSDQGSAVPEKEPLVGFWIYDLFPYTLAGVIDENRKLLDRSPSARYIISYDRYFNVFATIRGEKGLALKAKLEEMRNDHRAATRDLNTAWRQKMHAALLSAGIQHPDFKKE